MQTDSAKVSLLVKAWNEPVHGVQNGIADCISSGRRYLEIQRRFKQNTDRRGGSLLAASPEFESLCVTKADYEEIEFARCQLHFMH